MTVFPIPPFPIPHSDWLTLSGNQIGVLLAEFLLRRLQVRWPADTPIITSVKTLVTSDMVCRVAEHFGIRCFGDVLTGFKWIGNKIDEIGPENFVFGFEEAHGYLAGTYTRDKDGAVAAMLLAELAAECKSEGQTLHEQLDRLFVRIRLPFGTHDQPHDARRRWTGADETSDEAFAKQPADASSAD